MSETTENARRWNGYVCPDCRFVFRVPRDHDGKGIVCPSCRRMLRIPGADDTPPPLTKKSQLKVTSVGASDPQRPYGKAAAGEISPPVYKTAVPDPEAHRVLEKKRRRPEPQEEEQPNWDKVSGHRSRVDGGSKRNRRTLIVVAVMVVVTLLSAVGFVMLRDRSEKAAAAAPVVAPPVPAADLQHEETVAAGIELPLEMNRNETVLLAELEPLTRKFLEATTVDEMLPLIRNRAAMEPKMRKFYPGGKIDAPGMTTFNASGSVAYRSKLASLSVRTREFELKQIAFIRSAEGMKIDWESFVGWSEMDWAEFLAKKPTQPVLFRATLKEVEYYNFSFNDDRKWESFQFRSPDTESVLYGYTKRDSPESAKLRLGDPKATSLVTVRLKFLPGETSKNQVIVDSVVADGWVEGIDEK